MTVRWYINDASLQGQFATSEAFEATLRQFLDLRRANHRIMTILRTAHAISERPVAYNLTLRQALQASRNRDLKVEAITWLDRTGPFMDDDRLAESEDYFECLGIDVTNGGLGEAARRTKAEENASTFSFEGGAINFAVSPLRVAHGLIEERLGEFLIPNVWLLDDLRRAVWGTAPDPTSWKELVFTARERFPRLTIPDTVYLNPALAREPFDSAIRERVLVLLGHLDAYMRGRLPGGAEGPRAREIIANFFTGERAAFTGESSTNQSKFASELTFRDPDDRGKTIFAHWHGKISRGVFRVHFEWPVPADSNTLKVLYIGPKITKT